MIKNLSKMGPNTRAVQAAAGPDPATGAVMPPIFQSSTYAQPAPGEYEKYEYSRSGNPSRDGYEEALAALEGGEHGIAFASGLAATQAILQLLDPGDHVLMCDDVYGGTGRLCRRLYAKYGIDFDFIDMSDLATLRSAIHERTRMIWIETPTNPTMKIVDIRAAVQLAAGRDCRVVVDNTFASPIFQLPLALGADLVLHSTTKYIGGHSDLVGGAIMTSDDALAEQLKFIQFAAGAVPSPFECYLAHRSIKTLGLRMARHEVSALAVAEMLEGHPKVRGVRYPGLPSHSQHDLARAQMSGFSGIVSLYLDGGYPAVLRFLDRLELFVLAERLGGVESLVNHPEKMTHASVPPELREELGITGSFLRLSVGIEDTEDLLRDLENALE
ncbi:MAG: aminotransferase class I/II-fold pyridoxal phosphate-dependent enzyme [Holophagales bacterium]|nr:aminotransferase class I/II-fold pyridoxal phosphate-dependent enzyme [Holophagales bacterium]